MAVCSPSSVTAPPRSLLAVLLWHDAIWFDAIWRAVFQGKRFLRELWAMLAKEMLLLGECSCRLGGKIISSGRSRCCAVCCASGWAPQRPAAQRCWAPREGEWQRLGSSGHSGEPWSGKACCSSEGGRSGNLWALNKNRSSCWKLHFLVESNAVKAFLNRSVILFSQQRAAPASVWLFLLTVSQDHFLPQH